MFNSFVNFCPICFFRFPELKAACQNPALCRWLTLTVLWSRCMWQEMVYLWLVGSARWIWNNRCWHGECSMKTWSSWGQPWTPAAPEAAPYDARWSLFAFMLSPAISSRSHSVLWLSVTPCVHVWELGLKRYPTHRPWEFHQICNLGEVLDEDELVRFWGLKVRGQGHIETK